MTKKEINDAIYANLKDIRSLVEQDKYDDAMNNCATLTWLIGNGSKTGYEQDTRKLIVDFTDDMYSDKDFNDTLTIIADTLCLNTANNMFICKIEYYLSCDEHTDCQAVYNLYEWLNKFLEAQDCKNGLQIYENPDGERYLCITGRDYYYYYIDIGEFKGIDEVHVYIKSKNWEDL